MLRILTNFNNIVSSSEGGASKGNSSIVIIGYNLEIGYNIRFYIHQLNTSVIARLRQSISTKA